MAPTKTILCFEKLSHDDIFLSHDVIIFLAIKKHASEGKKMAISGRFSAFSDFSHFFQAFNLRKILRKTALLRKNLSQNSFSLRSNPCQGFSNFHIRLHYDENHKGSRRRRGPRRNNALLSHGPRRNNAKPRAAVTRPTSQQHTLLSREPRDLLCNLQLCLNYSYLPMRQPLPAHVGEGWP